MILGTAQLLLWLFLGAGLLRRLRIRLTLPELLGGGCVLGLALGSVVALGCICLLGYRAGSTIGALACALITAGTFALPERASLSRPEPASTRGAFIPWLAVTGASTGVLGWLFWTHMLWEQDGVYMSGGGTWGDLALHLSLVSRFATQERFTWDLPIYEDARLTYPFLADFTSGLLVRAGWSLREALLVPGLLLALASVQLLFAVALRWLRNAGAAVLATLVFFLNGSPAGLVYLWRDWRTGGDSLLKFLGSLPHDYAHLTDQNLHFTNIVSSYVLPQRSILLGLPAFLVMALLLRCAWEAPPGRRARSLFAAALLLALLPLAHVHTFFVALGVWMWLAAAVALQERRISREWLFALLAALAAAAPQVIWLLSGALDRDFSRWYVGWMRQPGEHLAVFWVRNMGLGVPLLLGYLIPLWLRRREDPFLTHFYSALACLFILTNLYIFQPHAFDNMKFMIYPYLAFAIVTGALLARWFRGAAGPRLLAACLLFSLTGAGAASVLHEAHTAWPFLGREEIALARALVRIVPPEARVLTSDQHNHPVPTLTGRRIVMGYRGWLWTYGIDYRERERDVATMFAGGVEAERLLAKHGVSFVVIGPSERSGFNAQAAAFDSRYPVVLRSANYTVYDVRGAPGVSATASSGSTS